MVWLTQGGPESSLMFCTNSVLLRQLTRGSVHEEMRQITHIVIDEIHERDRYADFMLIVLKVIYERKLVVWQQTIPYLVLHSSGECHTNQRSGELGISRRTGHLGRRFMNTLPYLLIRGYLILFQDQAQLAAPRRDSIRLPYGMT